MKRLISSFFLLLLAACSSTETKLPVLGNAVIKGTDSIYPAIPSFAFVDQNNKAITEVTFKNKIYVADFIFLSCPSICPKMTVEMKKVYDALQGNPNVLFLSHSIDPQHDTVERLKKYTTALGIDQNVWHFVTGNRDSIYKIAEKNYFSTAYPDKTAPGGYVHSGGLLLVDKKKHIRGVYDGTNPEETDRLIRDIKNLEKEQFPN